MSNFYMELDTTQKKLRHVHEFPFIRLHNVSISRNTLLAYLYGVYKGVRYMNIGFYVEKVLPNKKCNA